jgi:hypothetical protein
MATGVARSAITSLPPTTMKASWVVEPPLRGGQTTSMAKNGGSATPKD